MTDRPTIVVEVRGPQRSGVTTFTELLSVLLRRYVQSDRLFTPPRTAGRAVVDLVYNFQDLGTHVEVREAEPDDRDRELASLRQERDRLRADVARLQRRQLPAQPVSVERSTTDTSELKVSGTGTSVDGEYVSKARYDTLLAEFVELEARMRGLEK